MSFLPPGPNTGPSLPLPPKATTAGLSPTPTPTPAPPSLLYKNYLHKFPHLTFTLAPSPQFSTCTACDITTPFEHHTCVNCGLQLCGMCHYLITGNLIHGDLKRLIQKIARWKLGYSKSFLERERLEEEQDRRRKQDEWNERKGIMENRRKLQEDIDMIFESMIMSFKAAEGVEGVGLESGSESEPRGFL